MSNEKVNFVIIRVSYFFNVCVMLADERWNGDILISAEGWFSKPIGKAEYLLQQYVGALVATLAKKRSSWGNESYDGYS